MSKYKTDANREEFLNEKDWVEYKKKLKAIRKRRKNKK